MLLTRAYQAGDENVVFRSQDEAECRAGIAKSCAECISSAARSGLEVLTGFDSETRRPVLFFGVAPVSPEAGAVWMLATPELLKHRKQFVRESPQWIARFHAQSPLLFNWVDARNELHIRWLKRMGFTFITLHPEWGAERRPFYEFVRLPPCATPP